MIKTSIIREIHELKSILSYSVNIGFFFGAGTSCAIGIPDITQLTLEVESRLTDKDKTNFDIIKNDLSGVVTERHITIEDIINQARIIREITLDNKDKNYLGITGQDAKGLDMRICEHIYAIISESEANADITKTTRFFAWLNLIRRGCSKEVFTTNYDLVFEKALESSQIPYFDGFVGSYEPFFCNESIEKFTLSTDLTHNWIRLWKIHGSLSWFWKQDNKSNSYKIYRLGKTDPQCTRNNELVIYPSREKYTSSRKQPFISYFDRLRNYLLSGELLFIISGYSFSDQHVNEVILSSLRQNSRLTVIAFFYKDSEISGMVDLVSSYLNFIAFGPKTAIISGKIVELNFNHDELRPNEEADLFWDNSSGILKLGDFNNLTNFLITCSGQNNLVQDS